MFITFEGIDGSGKSTQIQLLAKYFEAKGQDVIILREPGGTDLSERIRELLLSKANNLNSITELFLFEAARADLVEKVIKPAIGEGKVVLSDRFYDSTTAYQGYGRGLSIEDIKKNNIMATLGLIPDITFFLDASIAKCTQRLLNKEPDRIELSGTEFFEKVSDGFREIAKAEPNRVYLIDSSGTIEETYIRIIEIIEKVNK
jgi:dTMP kinase